MGPLHVDVRLLTSGEGISANQSIGSTLWDKQRPARSALFAIRRQGTDVNEATALAVARTAYQEDSIGRIKGSRFMQFDADSQVAGCGLLTVCDDPLVARAPHVTRDEEHATGVPKAVSEHIQLRGSCR